MGLAAYLNVRPLQGGRVTTSGAPTGGRPPVAGSSGKIDTFVRQDQQQDYWCWAAVAASHADYFGTSTLTQCQIVNSIKGGACCVDANADDLPCNDSHTLEDVLTSVGVPRDYFPPISFDDIRDEIRAKRPLPCRVEWRSPPGGHFVTISGWKVTPTGVRYVDVDDPWREYRSNPVPFETFCNRYQKDGFWTHAYLRPHPAGGSALRIMNDARLRGPRSSNLRGG